jgi:hypothetical protein
MKHFIPAFLGLLVFGSAIGRGDEPPVVVDPWTFWNSDTTTLWGANVFQKVDPESRKEWIPLLRPHDFDDLYRAGANYVNFSMPGPYEPESGSFNADDWKHLEDRVKWAKAAKLKIVISFRTGPGRNEADITCPFSPGVKRDLLDDPKSPNITKFCAMWQMVAKKYGSDAAVVGFDLLVEPHAPKKWEKSKFHDYHYRKSNRWRDVAGQAIKAIRDQKVTTPILVEPDLWAGAIYLNEVDDPEPKGGQLAWTMPDGDRLVCAVHQYEPWRYTEDGAEAFDIDFVALKKAFCAIMTWRRKWDVPVCVNEFGAKQALPYTELFLRKELRLLKQQSLNHAVWLWEVTDPQWDYHDFDVRYNPKVLAELRANWKENAGGQNKDQLPAEKKAERARPAPRASRTGPLIQPAPTRGSDGHASARLPLASEQRMRESSTSRSDCDSVLYDPALKVQVPVADARDEFSRLSDESPVREEDNRVLVAQKASRRSRAVKSARRGAVNDGVSRSIGYWPKSDQLLFTASTAIRHVIVFADAVGGDFHTHLYQTSTNRSEKGTEAHIAFAPSNCPWFWIYDWSLCDDRLIRHVPISKMHKWVFPVRVGGFERKGVLVVNQTRLVKDTTWTNCVYLGVFQNGRLVRFDVVYSNAYILDNNDEQRPCCNGFWGPQIESFQNYKRPVNEMGFTGCWMIQDGKSIALDESNTELHDDDKGYGLVIVYKKPLSREFLVH